MTLVTTRRDRRHYSPVAVLDMMMTYDSTHSTENSREVFEIMNDNTARKKRRRWPWIVGAIVAVIVLAPLLMRALGIGPRQATRGCGAKYIGPGR